MTIQNSHPYRHLRSPYALSIQPHSASISQPSVRLVTFILLIRLAPRRLFATLFPNRVLTFLLTFLNLPHMLRHTLMKRFRETLLTHLPYPPRSYPYASSSIDGAMACVVAS